MTGQGTRTTNLHRAKRPLAVCVAALLAGVSAQALEWQTEPTVSLMSTNDSNYRLRTANERAVSSSRLDANASIVGASDRLSLELRPRVRSINFSDDREFDRTDKFLYSSIAVGGERQRLEVSADFVRDGTLTNALEDTGFTEVDAERDRTIYGLEWAAATSEFGTFAIGFNTHNVEYIDDLPFSPLVDYDYASLRLSYAHRLSERGSLTVSLTGGELDSMSAFGKTENSGLTLAYERALSDSMTMRIAGGQYETRRPSLFVPDSRDSSLDFSLQKRWDGWTLTTGLAANIEPSAFGVLWRRESVSVRVGHQFSERFDASMQLNGGNVVSEGNSAFQEDRSFADMRIAMNWRVAERLWLSFDVGTRAQEYANSPRASGDYGQLAFTYRGRGS